MAYRRYERRALDRVVLTRSRVVIATGGGLVSELSTFERLLEACYTIWLQASPHDYWERVLRQGDYRVSDGVGVKQAMADMRRILAQREARTSKAMPVWTPAAKPWPRRSASLRRSCVNGGPDAPRIDQSNWHAEYWPTQAVHVHYIAC